MDFSFLLAPVAKILDKIFPDANERQKARVRLLELESQGELEEVKAEISVMLAEASSEDPWTSRARPTFMYVIYALLLLGVPLGILNAVSQETARLVVEGFALWLKAIPQELYELFTWAFLGYGLFRTGDKVLPKVFGGKKRAR